VKGDGRPSVYSLGDGLAPKAISSLPTRPLAWAACPQPALLEHPLSHAEPQREIDASLQKAGRSPALEQLVQTTALAHNRLEGRITAPPEKESPLCRTQGAFCLCVRASPLGVLSSCSHHTFVRRMDPESPSIKWCLAIANSSAPLCPDHRKDLTRLSVFRLSYWCFGSMFAFQSPWSLQRPQRVLRLMKYEG
jgi:hypothetical protein